MPRPAQFKISLPAALLLILAALSVAAPRPKPLPAEPAEPDVVAGTLNLHGSPTVEVTKDKGSYHVWLVFPNSEAEVLMLLDRKHGQPIVAVGRLGRGGNYVYIVVERLETP